MDNIWKPQGLPSDTIESALSVVMISAGIILKLHFILNPSHGMPWDDTFIFYDPIYPLVIQSLAHSLVFCSFPSAAVFSIRLYDSWTLYMYLGVLKLKTYQGDTQCILWLIELWNFLTFSSYFFSKFWFLILLVKFILFIHKIPSDCGRI